jgi:hypothetical protein
METITITTSVSLRASYIRHVLDCGHIPGVLSGANIKGKARRYGGKYARSRAIAATIAAQAGVKQDVILLSVGSKDKSMRRHCRVWVRDGKPVCLVIAAA